MKITNLTNIKAFAGIILAIFSLSFTGCIRPVEPKVLEHANSNETMFVIPLVGENQQNQAKFASADYFNQKKVGVKEYQIPMRWLQTGRFDWDGDWIPAVRVIKVDRSPVTVQFAVDDVKNAKTDKDAIWVESADSVGFSTGFSISALITEEDSAVFLYRYQAKALADVIRTEVRARVQSRCADFCAQYKLDTLRSKKVEMMAYVREDVVPFFKERGISITTIGQFGGMVYENPSIQSAIDNVFVKQQEKEVAAAALAAQKDINAKSESAAQQERANDITRAQGIAEATRLKAQAEAAGNLLLKEADAKGITLVNQALKDAASNPMYVENKRLDNQRVLNEKWSGNLPQTIVGNSDGLTLFLNGIPGVNGTQK